MLSNFKRFLQNSKFSQLTSKFSNIVKKALKDKINVEKCLN